MIIFSLFLYTLTLMITLSALFPYLHILYFAPFIVFTIYRRPKIASIWIGLVCGLAIDLFSAQTRFGVYALNYTLTTWTLYKIQHYFFEDSLTTIPIMTLFFVWFSAIYQVFFLYAFDSISLFSWIWLKVEFIKYPLYSVLYSCIFFLIPALLFPRKTKKAPSLVRFKEHA